MTDYMKTAVRFVRTDLSDGATEVLTLVRVEGIADYMVEVCAGPNVGDGFVGLYDLDGSQRRGDYEWEAVSRAPDEVICAIEENWAIGNMVVERMRAVRGADGRITYVIPSEIPGIEYDH